MRDRLIELLCNVKCEGEECFGNYPHRIGQKCNKVQRLEMCSVFAIADHLLAEGVIVPPCKVGDKTFLLLEKLKGGYDIVESKCVCITDNGHGNYYSMYIDCVDIGNSLEFDFSDFGKTVFLTKEEAEKTLAERSEE